MVVNFKYSRLTLELLFYDLDGRGVINGDIHIELVCVNRKLTGLKKSKKRIMIIVQRYPKGEYKVIYISLSKCLRIAFFSFCLCLIGKLNCKKKFFRGFFFFWRNHDCLLYL